MTIYLKKYIRDEKRNPHGVVVLVREDNGNKLLGYSLCSPKDKFDKKLGTAIALRRATDNRLEQDEALAPLVSDRRELVCQYYMGLEKRAAKYFKQDYEGID